MRSIFFDFKEISPDFDLSDDEKERSKDGEGEDPPPSRPRRLRPLPVALVALLVGLGGGWLVARLYTPPPNGGRPEALEKCAATSQKVAVSVLKLESLQQRMRRLERLGRHVGFLAQLTDRRRWLAAGPLERPRAKVTGRAAHEKRDTDPLGRDNATMATGRSLLSFHSGHLRRRVGGAEDFLRRLLTRVVKQQALLRSVPSRWPVRGWVTSNFGRRRDPYTGRWSHHKGLDIANRKGTPIISPADGTVVFASRRRGFGKVIYLDHGVGFRTRYAHLSRIRVKVGQKVRRGDRIGDMGSTGRATGPHLHYEVRLRGVPVNPRRFLLD